MVHAFQAQYTGPPISISASTSRPRQMPSWMSFFLQAGTALAEQPLEQPSTAVAISPAREFAAVVAAVGVVQARRAIRTVLANQFEEVWASDQQLTVRYVLAGKELRGRVVERLNQRGERFLRLQETAKRSGTTLLPERSAHNLAILEDGSSRRARAVGITDPWLAEMLQGCDDHTYLLANRFDCLLVGQANQLRNESDLVLHIKAQVGKDQILSGSLHCLLRVRRWQPPGTTFSCDVIPDRSDPQEHDLQEFRRFQTVIFDGATAYLRWHECFSGQHHLVVLHQSDRRLEEAVNGLDQEFRLRATDWSPAVICPKGTEFISFRRRE